MKTFNLSILISLFILSSKILFAQFSPAGYSCIDFGYWDFYDSVEYIHIVNKDTIVGKIPKDNKYTGLVKEYTKIYRTAEYIRVSYKGIEKTIEEVIYEPYFAFFKKYEGSYLEGKKTGLFSFFSGLDCNDFTIEYTEDSIIRKPAVYDSFKFVCTADSSFCIGRLKTRHEYDIHYKCENSTCEFYHKGAKTLVLKCDQIDLESSLYGFYYGNYDREIRNALLMEQQSEKTNSD